LGDSEYIEKIAGGIVEALDTVIGPEGDLKQ
jgi:hypothetical protein